MPEGFLRSLHRRSVRARQALFVRRHKSVNSASDHVNEAQTNSTSEKVETTANVTCVCAASGQNNIRPSAQTSSNTTAQTQPDIITSAVQIENQKGFIDNSEEDEVVLRHESLCSTPSLENCKSRPKTKEIRFEIPKSHTKEIAIDTPRPQTIGSALEITRSETQRFTFNTPRSEKKDAKPNEETPRKGFATPRNDLTTSFLRRSMRRRSVLHFHTPRAEVPATLPGEARCGMLLKFSSSALARKQSRKFVALHEDGSLRYFPNAQDYTTGNRGKDIPLRCAAVRVPRGQGKQCSRSASLATSGYATPCRGSWYAKDEVELTGFQERRSGGSPRRSTQDLRSINDESTPLPGGEARQFEIVSSEGRAWRFEAVSVAERDDWVRALERAILRSLQHSVVAGEENAALALRTVAGNNICADCSAPEPTWASVTLGVLVCIECSGAHRSLQISRVRSLELDHWTHSQVSALRLIGNTIANCVWESNIRDHIKPTPNSSVDEKRNWVHNKYATRQFLTPRLSMTTQELQTAIRNRDVRSLLAVDTLSAHALLLLAREAQDEALTQLMTWQCIKQPGCSIPQAVNTEVSSLVDLIESCTNLI